MEEGAGKRNDRVIHAMEEIERKRKSGESKTYTAEEVWQLLEENDCQKRADRAGNKLIGKKTDRKLLLNKRFGLQTEDNE